MLVGQIIYDNSTRETIAFRYQIPTTYNWTNEYDGMKTVVDNMKDFSKKMLEGIHGLIVICNNRLCICSYSYSYSCTKGGIPLPVFPEIMSGYIYYKVIFQQVNYNCSGIPLYFPETFRKYSNFKEGIPLQICRKSLSSKHFRTLFPEILVV